MSKEYPCVHYEKMLCKKFSKIGITSFCVMGPCPHKTPSNADRIRAMSDEELADFLDRWAMGDIDYSKTFCDLCNGQFMCDQCRLDWLKQPAKDVDNG